ncbi:MAG: pyridoxal-phosphate-dependent aminotransferase family protein [Anaerolineales bacterium]
MRSHKLLMIPGPIEFDPQVLAALGAATTSHMDAGFIEAFGSSLEMMREVFMAPHGQPFILAGSGTLGMDAVAANLVESGDPVLLINTGFFSERFGEILTRYGAELTQIKSPIGSRPSLEEVQEALRKKRYKLLVVTHVDTSTGVITDVRNLANLAQKYGAMSVVDGVCSVGAEELRMEEWGVDVALTASQKAIGVPPGLALWMVGQRALEWFKQRKSAVLNYYSDWNNWLPVMLSHEERKPNYFCTPAVNLVWALQVSLKQILAEGMEARFQRHQKLSQVFKAAIQAWELDQIPLSEEYAAHTLTAVRYPAGVQGTDLIKAVAQQGIVISGGLHPEIKSQYFRVGHMGVTTFGDIMATVSAIEQGLVACGYPLQVGIGLTAAQRQMATDPK